MMRSSGLQLLTYAAASLWHGEMQPGQRLGLGEVACFRQPLGQVGGWRRGLLLFSAFLRKRFGLLPKNRGRRWQGALGAGRRAAAEVQLKGHHAPPPGLWGGAPRRGAGGGGAVGSWSVR